jgi:AraC family transcriptional regulator of adaptative response/methylated-DNA-[protein]-cysteine methyltransferase
MDTIEEGHDAMEDEYWLAVERRDRRYDGRFVFGVKTTGIYCRPSCPARHPKREHVRFFAMPAEAAAARFRACLRCKPTVDLEAEPRRLVDAACKLIDTRLEDGLRLQDLSRELGSSEARLRAAFQSVLGLTPRRYAAARRLEAVKGQLRNGAAVTEAQFAAGYGSSSRLYEQASARLGMTPATYKNGGKRMRISYSIVPCALGSLLVGSTERGVCAVYLGEQPSRLEQELRAEYRQADFIHDDQGRADWVRSVVGMVDGVASCTDEPLDLQGTAFTWKVRELLRSIPAGETRTYGELARQAGSPGAARAVGRVCATNPVSLAIPCHRVVREDGRLGGYRWGLDRKQALLDCERKAAPTQ